MYGPINPTKEVVMSTFDLNQDVTGGLGTARPVRRRLVLALLTVMLALAACSGGDQTDVTGTYTHPEEGTIVLNADGTGSITQSSDPVPFTWVLTDGTVALTIDGEVQAEATASGSTLTFRAGDFSGDEAVTFTKS